MGLCICRDWLLKETNSFTPERDPEKDFNNARVRNSSGNSVHQPRYHPHSEPPNDVNDHVIPDSSGIHRTFLELPSLPAASHQNQSIEVINPGDRSFGENAQEISYNKISVREPLSKVLAERAILEHHYNEVDEEGNSCFYEEIAGATNSSVTSFVDESKLGRQSSDEADVITDPGYEVVKFHQQKSEPCYAIIDKSLNNSGNDEPDSQTMSAHGNKTDRQSDKEDYSLADPGYEVVNFSPQKSEPCYAIIDKNSNNSKNTGIDESCQPSSSSTVHKIKPSRQSDDDDDDDDYLMADPGYEVINLTQQKCEPCYSVISKSYNKSGKTLSNSGDDKTRHSDDEYDLTADPGYEVINLNHQKVEHCYAVIDKNVVSPDDGEVSGIRNQSKASIVKDSKSRQPDDYDLIADPGYEVINPYSQKSEPCYAVIRKNLDNDETCGSKSSSISSNVNDGTTRQSDDDDFVADPGYEVINCHKQKSEDEPCYAVINKNCSKPRNSDSNKPQNSLFKTIVNHSVDQKSEDEDDSSADPGYEIVNFHQQPENDEPCYSVVKKNLK